MAGKENVQGKKDELMLGAVALLDLSRKTSAGARMLLAAAGAGCTEWDEQREKALLQMATEDIENLERQLNAVGTRKSWEKPVVDIMRNGPDEDMEDITVRGLDLGGQLKLASNGKRLAYSGEAWRTQLKRWGGKMEVLEWRRKKEGEWCTATPFEKDGAKGVEVISFMRDDMTVQAVYIQRNKKGTEYYLRNVTFGKINEGRIRSEWDRNGKLVAIDGVPEGMEVKNIDGDGAILEIHRKGEQKATRIIATPWANIGWMNKGLAAGELNDPETLAGKMDGVMRILPTVV